MYHIQGEEIIEGEYQVDDPVMHKLALTDDDLVRGNRFCDLRC